MSSKCHLKFLFTIYVLWMQNSNQKSTPRQGCAYTNANSVIGKMTELRHRADAYDLIGIVESWGTDAVYDSELAIQGFKMLRIDRRESKGGGLLLYIREDLEAVECNDTMGNQFKESLWCTIRTASKSKLLVGLIYWSPASDELNNEALLNLLQQATQRNDVEHVMIMGDMNYPDIDFLNNMVNAGEHAASSKLFEKTQDLFLHQHVTNVTRIRSDQTPSILYYVFTDDRNLIDEIDYLAPLGKSDHLFLSWFVTLKMNIVNSIQEKLNFWKGDYS